MFSLGVVLSPNSRKCSRGSNDGPPQSTQIPCDRHSVQFSRLRRALPVPAGVVHELRAPLWGVVNPLPRRHQGPPACSHRPAWPTNLNGQFWLFLKHSFFIYELKVIQGESEYLPIFRFFCVFGRVISVFPLPPHHVLFIPLLKLGDN